MSIEFSTAEHPYLDGRAHFACVRDESDKVEEVGVVLSRDINGRVPVLMEVHTFSEGGYPDCELVEGQCDVSSLILKGVSHRSKEKVQEAMEKALMR